jgi:hypothetical protein
VVFSEECIAESDESNEAASAQSQAYNQHNKSSVNKRNNKTFLTSSSSSEEEEKDSKEYPTYPKLDKKKKNAVKEYKKAISSISRKTTKEASPTSTSLASGNTKKQIDKVIVSESEYKMNDKWLIEDMSKSKKQPPNPFTTNLNIKKHTSTKRKLKSNDDDRYDDTDGVEEGEITYTCSTGNDLNNEDDDDEDYEAIGKSKSKYKRIENNDERASYFKKQIISEKASEFCTDVSHLNIKDNRNENLFAIINDDSNDNDSNNIGFCFFFDKILIYFFYFYFFLFSYKKFYDTFFFFNFSNGKQIDLIEKSPFREKSNAEPNLKNKYTKMHQLKLTKMNNYNLQNNSTSANDVILQSDKNQHKEKNFPSLKPYERTNSDLNQKTESNQSQNWKIKAIIDNRNFLIPIS